MAAISFHGANGQAKAIHFQIQRRRSNRKQLKGISNVVVTFHWCKRESRWLEESIGNISLGKTIRHDLEGGCSETIFTQNQLLENR